MPPGPHPRRARCVLLAAAHLAALTTALYNQRLGRSAPLPVQSCCFIAWAAVVAGWLWSHDRPSVSILRLGCRCGTG